MKAHDDDYRLIRIWKKTHRTLKVLAAYSQESLVELLDRLADQERTMKQFEYRTVELYYQVSDSPVLQYDDPSSGASSYQTYTLDKLGEQGWELVTIKERPASSIASRTKSRLVGIFKREKRAND